MSTRPDCMYPIRWRYAVQWVYCVGMTLLTMMWQVYDSCSTFYHSHVSSFSLQITHAPCHCLKNISCFWQLVSSKTSESLLLEAFAWALPPSGVSSSYSICCYRMASLHALLDLMAAKTLLQIPCSWGLSYYSFRGSLTLALGVYDSYSPRGESDLVAIEVAWCIFQQLASIETPDWWDVFSLHFRKCNLSCLDVTFLFRSLSSCSQQCLLL